MQHNKIRTEKKFINNVQCREVMLSLQREADAMQLAQNKGPVKVRGRDTIVYDLGSVPPPPVRQ